MELSKQQKRAVESDSQYIAIIAGAGSGKTHTLTERICYLIDKKGVKAEEILALTFTSIFYNKMIHNNINICERRYRENLEKEKYPRLKDVELRRRKYFDIRFHKEFADKFIKVS